MLNFDAKDKAIESLKRSIKQHESLVSSVQDLSKLLFERRQQAATHVIQEVENYVNTLANSPKEFDKAVAEYRVEVNRFRKTVQALEIKAAEAAQVGGGAALAGMTAGAGVAAFAPTAAMAIATTFGTASTGTAISALSGAAATNAALAWLGGGALVAGGGGMAAGNALLLMAGPIGWTIGGVALVGSGMFLNAKNAEAAEQATKQRLTVEAEIHSLKLAKNEIEHLSDSTKKFMDSCLELLLELCRQAPKDYKKFKDEQKQHLSLLINAVRSLGTLLNTQVNV
jgi:hypothetical protein